MHHPRPAKTGTEIIGFLVFPQFLFYPFSILAYGIKRLSLDDTPKPRLGDEEHGPPSLRARFKISFLTPRSWFLLSYE
jgi:hypothetical protein